MPKYKRPSSKGHRVTEKARFEILLEMMRDEFRGLGDGLAAVNERLDRIDSRLDSIEKRLESLELRVAHLEQRIAALEQRMTALEQRMTALEQRVSRVEHAVLSLKSDLKAVAQRIDKSDAQTKMRLEQLYSRVTTLETKVSAL